MNTLPLTVAILALLTIMTLGRLHKSSDEALLRGALLARVAAARELDNRVQATLYEIKVRTNLKPGPPKGSKPQPRDPEAPKKKRRKTPGKPILEFASKLNLSPLLDGTNALYDTLFLNLLEALYPDLITSRDTAELLLQKLREKVSKIGTAGEPKGALTRAEQLACLQFEDPQLQELWFSILRCKQDSDRSLLDFVCIQKRRRKDDINITFAPTPLLMAIFGNAELVSEIEKSRKELIDSYDRDTSTLKILEGEFSRFVSDCMQNHTNTGHEFETLFDYSFQHRPGAITVKTQEQATVRLKRTIQVEG